MHKGWSSWRARRFPDYAEILGKVPYRSNKCTSSIIFLSVGQAPFKGMSLRKRTDGRVFHETEFVDLGEMRKLLVAGDPSDSDPGYEVAKVLTEWTARNYCHWLQSKVLSHIVCTHNVPTMHRTSPADINDFHNVLTCWNKWKRKWLLINESESGSVKVKDVNPVSRWLRILRLPMHEQWASTSATWDWGKLSPNWN